MSIQANSAFREFCRRCLRLISAFSLRSNGGKILQTTRFSGDITCMYGLRALSVLWIMLLHSDNLATLERPVLATLDSLPWWPVSVLGPTLVPDTFLLLSGTLLSYNHFRNYWRSSSTAPRGPSFWAKRLVKRYWRLTPPHMSVVWLLAIGLSWYWASSPFWPVDRVAGLEPGCSPYWWRNLLLIHNFFPHQDMCIDQTWYLAVEWQLFVVSPFLLIALERSAFWGGLLHVVLIGSAAFLELLLAVIYDFVGEMVDVLASGTPANNLSFRDVTYDKPYIRSVGFLLGILLGRFISQLDHQTTSVAVSRVLDQLRQHSWLRLAAELVAIALMALGAGLIPTLLNVPVPLVYTHIGVQRLLWCVGIALIVFLGSQKLGGPVDAFLSWGFFHPLGRLTYCTYLLHPILLAGFWSAQEVQTYPTPSMLLAVVLASGVVSFTVAFFWSLLFEMPHLEIMKMVVDGKW